LLQLPCEYLYIEAAENPILQVVSVYTQNHRLRLLGYKSKIAFIEFGREVLLLNLYFPVQPDYLLAVLQGA